jgi:membrane fusion protein (multidrug efflux system)
MTQIADQVEALGTLKANESVNLTSTVTETITAVHFEGGLRVEKGTILVEMENAEELAELAEQESYLAESRRQVKRLQPLVRDGAASESVLDEREREMETAQARVNAIQSRINKRIIKAPYDGIVGIRNISVGSLAQPGTLMTTIDDDSQMKLDFSVPEIFISAINTGGSIKAFSESYPEKTFEGTISAVDSRIDPVTRSIIARALIANPDGVLKPGLLMKVDLQKDLRDTLIVSEEAIISEGSLNYVMLVADKDGTTIAQRQNVKIGTRQFGLAEILEGVQEGDQVITHGTLRARSGAEIKITAVENNDETLVELLEQNSDKSSDKNSETSEDTNGASAP